jgi:hypothetical protein
MSSIQIQTVELPSADLCQYKPLHAVHELSEQALERGERFYFEGGPSERCQGVDRYDRIEGVALVPSGNLANPAERALDIVFLMRSGKCEAESTALVALYATGLRDQFIARRQEHAAAQAQKPKSRQRPSKRLETMQANVQCFECLIHACNTYWERREAKAIREALAEAQARTEARAPHAASETPARSRAAARL